MKLYRQHDIMDCGPTCLRMVANHYGRTFSLQELRKKSSINREGVSLMGISDAAEAIGFRTIGVKIPYEKLVTEVPLPCILHWNQNHFVVLYKAKKDHVWVADPIGHKVKLSKSDFIQSWASGEGHEKGFGIALLLEPTPAFYEIDIEEHEYRKNSISYLFSYFKHYKRFIVQLFIGLIVSSLVQLTFPFLTQSIVDVGINTRDIGFIYLILAGQLMLFFSRTTVDFIRQWILLHLSTRINIFIISDFLIKLMKLPLSFFDSKMIGDLLQRIDDHSRIEEFLSSSSLSILFSIVNVFVFGSVLMVFNVPIFLLFFGGSTLYLIYLTLFLKKTQRTRLQTLQPVFP